MKTVKEVSDLTGVTVRALRYYDEIGLLPPTVVAINGYRYYDEAALTRLQEILFFRELGFALKDIKSIINNPSYDRGEALMKHINLLNLQKQRLSELIELAQAALKGERTMEFDAFDDKDIKASQEKYQAEAKERWGETKAYAESEDKTAHYTAADWQIIQGEMDGIMARFAAHAQDNPADPDIQDLVKQWQEFLTKYYYQATNEILASLGQMYISDDRFTANIDKYGPGTAALLSQAIAIYVKN